MTDEELMEEYRASQAMLNDSNRIIKDTLAMEKRVNDELARSIKEPRQSNPESGDTVIGVVVILVVALWITLHFI